MADESRRAWSVERLTLDRVTLREAGRVAAEAFADDPFFCFLSPKERLRRRGLHLYFRSVAATLGDAGAAFGVRHDGRLAGVALWVKPDRYPLPVPAQLRQAAGAFWALVPRPRALIDGTRYLLAIDKAHPHETLWYLQLLAVDPAIQRSGIGGVLQEHIYAEADRDRLVSYLETQKEANLAYYRRFGYELVDELRPVKNGPPLWTMRREPRPE